MRKDTNVIQTVWMVLLTIISLIALARSFYSSSPLDFDYAGVLVGSLAALCTVLIGWQIYTLIDLYQAKRDREEFERKVEDEIHRSYIKFHSQLVGAFKSVIQNQDNQFRKTEYLMLSNFLELFFHKICVDDTYNLDAEFDILLKNLMALSPVVLTEMESLHIEGLLDDLRVECKKHRFTPAKPFKEIYRYLQLSTEDDLGS